MQEMTPEICASAKENDTTRLEDVRDGKLYWVAKLKDGNCWMTQNLDFDLSTGTPLTSELSDVSSTWTPTSSTYDSYSGGENGPDYHMVAQSWSPGGRDQLFAWSNITSTSDCDYESSTCSNWTNVTNLTPMTSIREDGAIIDGSTYDAHYLAGNYYSWEAATAGTGHDYTTRGDKAPDSICPAGWELPTSYSTYNSTPGSFYNLLNQYGLTSSPVSDPYDITKAPLYFVRAGNVFGGSSLYDAGYYGRYWSSVASSPSSACSLEFNPSRVSPSDNYGRYYGQPVRCVAPSA